MNFIGIENFRSLSGWHKFDLADITLLTGTNNSGKSSLISAVRILKDGIRGVYADMRNQQSEKPVSGYKIGNTFNIELTNSGDKRSGGFLSTLINKNEIEKNRLSFSLNGNFGYIDKPFEILLTFKISTRNLDLAFIDEILFKNESDGKIFLKIGTYDHRKPTIKIDFAYFVQTVRDIWLKGKDFYRRLSEMNEILQKEGEKNEQKILKLIADFEQIFDKKVNVSKKEDKYHVYSHFNNPFNLDFKSNEEEKKLFDLIKANQLYEFEYFLNYEKEGLPNFEDILSYYQEESIDSKLKLFSRDFIDCISKIEWKLENGSWAMDSIEYIIEYEKEDVVLNYLSLKKICYLLEKVNNRFETLRRETITKERLFLSNIATNIGEVYNDSPEFFDKVMIPFMNIIVNMSNEHKLFELKGNHHEEAVATLIDDVINDLQKNIRHLESAEFITSSRGLSSATFRNADTGEFHQMLQKLYALDDEKRDIAIWFISKWLKELDIADDFILKVDPNYRSYQACLLINEVEHPLNEFGFGTVQLLPLLLGITLHNPSTKDHVEKKCLLIEEPESNLHPALQSKLADMFVEAISLFNIRLVVETHSEYLIRKLQYLIAKGDAKPESTVIYYFNKPDDQRVISGMKERVVKITINEDGHLSDDFGPGFIDEANNISISLFGLNQRNRN